MGHRHMALCGFLEELAVILTEALRRGKMNCICAWRNDARWALIWQQLHIIEGRGWRVTVR